MIFKLYTQARHAEDMRFPSYEAAFAQGMADYAKIPVVPFIVDEIKRLEVRSVISFGSSIGILEKLIALAAPGVAVSATDYMTCEAMGVTRFDMKKDRRDIAYDMALCLGSLYVLDDDEMESFLRYLRSQNVRYLFDFHGGCVRTHQALWRSLQKPRGPIMHGYCRDPWHVRKIYKRAGWRIAPLDKAGRFEGYVKMRLNFKVNLLVPA